MALFSFRSSESFIVSYIFMTFLATSRTAEFHFCFGRYWCDHGRQTWKLTQTHTRSVLRRQTQSRLRVLCGEFRAYQVFDGTRVALYSYRKDHKNKLKWVSQAMLHCVKCCCLIKYYLKREKTQFSQSKKFLCSKQFDLETSITVREQEK